MGGTCVIRGCVPKKLMVFASGYRQTVIDAREYGWDVGDGAFDWPRFRGKLCRPSLTGWKASTATARERRRHHPRRRATVTDPHTVRAGHGRDVTAEHILVATGGRPWCAADIPGTEHGLVSNDIFHLDDLPKTHADRRRRLYRLRIRLHLQRAGREVTQYYRGAQILRGFDDEARGADRRGDAG